MGFCLKGEPREGREGREGREQREERVRHLKAAVWAAEKLKAQPPSPGSHLHGAGRQESVGNNKGGRVVGRVKSDAAVAKKERKKNSPPHPSEAMTGSFTPTAHFRHMAS